MVDVVDSKSTASDGVPVRVRPPAPNKKERLLASLFYFSKELRLEPIYMVLFFLGM